MTLIDSDVLIDASRGLSEAISKIEEIKLRGKPSISVITEMELIVGCRDKNDLGILEKFLSQFEILHIDEPVSRHGIA